jgi:menaquinone-specific isochorismate synthase
VRWLGLGAADEQIAEDPLACWSLPDVCRERLQSIDAPEEAREMLRYFGGISFDPGLPPRLDWEAGGRGRFLLPRVLIRHRAGESTAEIAITLPTRSRAEAEEFDARSRMLLGAVAESGLDSPAEGTPALREVEIPAIREHWDRAIRAALREIEGGSIRKVVLSREMVLEAARAIDPWTIMRRIESQRPHGVQFCFRFDEETALIGATPERLFRQDGRRIFCDCLAGTSARRGSDGEKEQSARELLDSKKDRHEHRFVLEGILEALAPVTEWLEHPARPNVLTLPKLHHLSSPVSGWMRRSTRLEDLLKRLHPTPAVGGSPRAEALGLIRELEGRPRGWYAGPIGWIADDRADFGVGIRSAIVRENRLTVIGGAGIVRGSTAENEWEETARKAASFLSLFSEESD